MLTAVVMAAVVILVACGSDSKNGRKKNPADNSDENLTLYYANSTWTDLFPEVFHPRPARHDGESYRHCDERIDGQWGNDG